MGSDRSAGYGWLFTAVWLFYLLPTVQTLLAAPGGWAQVTGLAAVVAFAALYLYVVAQIRVIRRTGRWPRPARGRMWACLLGLLALFAAQVPGGGAHALSCLVYIAAAAVIGLPLPQAVPLAVLLGAAAQLLPAVVPGWSDNGYGLAVLLGSAATYGIRLATDRQHRLVDAQHRIAELAVQNERHRIAADLHDILGHSLTVVTVKAELAQRLIGTDPGRARRELAQLEILARDALADVRATALGVRGISLPGEIAAARAALAAADVHADLPGAADEVPTAVRELFAWTLREAVTNVVRHSRATHVTVRLGADHVEILDDGTGPAAPTTTGGGQGLAGLHRRAEQAGARLTAGHRDDRPGFRVRMEVPT